MKQTGLGNVGCWLWLGLGIFVPLAWSEDPKPTAAAPTTSETAAEVLLVVGPSNHPPGTHEVQAGGRLLAYCLENARNTKPLRTRMVTSWPDNPTDFQAVRTIVFIGDFFPPARFPNSAKIMQQLQELTSKGCGIVCLHFATGLGKNDVPADGQHPLLDWIGGYFATHCDHHQSVARIMTATIKPAAAAHPILNGWQAFTMLDEPYYNNYFGPTGPRPEVTILATAEVPPEQPKTEPVAWACQRQDGGRGVAIVMPHFYHNWEVVELRTMVLNSIYWSAQQEVPAAGVQVEWPTLETFQPVAVTPPKPKPTPPKPDPSKAATPAKPNYD